MKQYTGIFEGKRVFITGHTGFKGSWLAAWLHRLGADVTGYALPPDGPNSHFEQLGLRSRIRHIEGDLRNPRDLNRAISRTHPEFVFHLAAQPLVRKSYAEPKLTFDTNIGGSVNLLEAVRVSRSARVLIYVTSDKCYRNRESHAGYHETDELGGHDPYSASKACAELVFASYQNCYFNSPEAVRAASVRAGNVIGGGDWSEDRIVPDCVRALLRGESVVLRNPGAVRPWQHVLEPLGGYLLLAAKLYETERYRGAWNFGPRRESHRTVDDLAATLLDLWGRGSKIAAVATDSRKETNFLSLNCDKAAHHLGWTPALGFRESVEYTVEWYKRAVSTACDVWSLTQWQIATYMAVQNAEMEAVAG